MIKATYNDIHKKSAYIVREDLKAFEVTGDDADEALNYLLTKENEFSDENTVNFQLALDDSGKVLAEVIVYKLEDKYVLFSSQNLSEILKGDYEDFEIEFNKNLKLIQIEGLKSPEIVSSLYSPYDISTLEFKAFDQVDFNDSKIILSRFGFTGEFGYQIVLNNSMVDEFISKFLDNIPVIDNELLLQTYVESGQPVHELLFNSGYSLAELGYLWNVDFTKEDFRGIEELKNSIKNLNKLLVGLRSNSEVINGSLVKFDNEKIGKVLLSVNDEGQNSDSKLSLGIVNYDYAVSGVKFLDEEGNDLVSQSSPFSIPESW